MPTTIVNVKRGNGTTVAVDTPTTQHAEVGLYGEARGEVRYVVIAAPDGRAARRLAKPLLREDETVDSARKIDRATLAVLILNGTEVPS